MTIKSHHNVGGLPKQMNLKICEPLKWLFKDEVRRVGYALGMPENLIKRHPFPGPGLAVRILGDITREKVHILQEADDIFIQGLHDSGLYDKVWQAGVILLPVQSVGVMGDERTYERARCTPRCDECRCHDSRLGSSPLRVPRQDIERYHQQGERCEPRLLRHLE
jgi:GMP synthase (glutamine-hydrolysing)